MTLYAHLTFPAAANFIDYLHDQLQPGVDVTFGIEIPQPATYHILIHGRPSSEMLTASPNLHTVVIPFAGLPTVTRDRLQEMPHIKVHNLHHNNSTTAEMALSMMFAAAKRLLPTDQIFRQHDWRPRYDPMPAQLLEGKTCVILGFGAIGQRIGRVCHALDMNVIGVKRTHAAIAPYSIITSGELQSALPHADVLMICAPLTKETKGIIGQAEIESLKSSAIVINVGRAAIVDEKALYDALVEKRIFAAGFDVWYNYPNNKDEYPHTPPANYPFHELDNMILSPHRAGGVGTPDIEYRRMDAIAQLLNAAAQGNPMPHPVDVGRGY